MEHKELLEEYKEMLSKYCYATADLIIKKDQEGEFTILGNLKDCIGINGGYFERDYVAEELKRADIRDFMKGINEEGYWRVEFIMKYFNGGDGESSYMELLITEPLFIDSFEDRGNWVIQELKK